MKAMGETSVINPEAIYSLAGACEAVGFGETFMRREIKTGKLNAKRAGNRIIKIKGKDLQEWFDALPSASTVTGSCGAESGMDGTSDGQMQRVGQRALTSAFATMSRCK